MALPLKMISIIPVLLQGSNYYSNLHRRMYSVAYFEVHLLLYLSLSPYISTIFVLSCCSSHPLYFLNFFTEWKGESNKDLTQSILRFKMLHIVWNILVKFHHLFLDFSPGSFVIPAPLNEATFLALHVLFDASFAKEAIFISFSALRTPKYIAIKIAIICLDR